MYMEILVKFKNITELVPYTTEVLDLAITDPDTEYILLAETGEVIFDRKSGLSEEGEKLCYIFCWAF